MFSVRRFSFVALLQTFVVGVPRPQRSRAEGHIIAQRVQTGSSSLAALRASHAPPPQKTAKQGENSCCVSVPPRATPANSPSPVTNNGRAADQPDVLPTGPPRAKQSTKHLIVTTLHVPVRPQRWQATMTQEGRRAPTAQTGRAQLHPTTTRHPTQFSQVYPVTTRHPIPCSQLHPFTARRPIRFSPVPRWSWPRDLRNRRW